MYVEKKKKKKKKKHHNLVIHCYPTFVKIDSVSVDRMQRKEGGILNIYIIFLEEIIFIHQRYTRVGCIHLH